MNWRAIDEIRAAISGVGIEETIIRRLSGSMRSFSSGRVYAGSHGVVIVWLEMEMEIGVVVWSRNGEARNRKLDEREKRGARRELEEEVVYNRGGGVAVVLWRRRATQLSSEIK